MTGPRRIPLAVLLLVLSGAASLVFETIWVKQLGLVVGVDVHAVSIALVGFFGGLAAGGLVLGRLAERTAHPARLYAALEAASGLAGFVATLVLSGLAPRYVSLSATVGPLAYALPIVVIGLPAFAMGGTLPALLCAVQPDAGWLAGCSGRLYAANTAGAILGALLTPFLLVPALGVRGTGALAAALDLGAAALALAWSRGLAPLTPTPSSEGPALGSTDARVAAGLYALAGAVAMGYQVAWSQAIVPFLSTRTAAFAVLVATYLGGLALGSAAFGRVADRVKSPWTALGGLLAGAGILALASLHAVGHWLPRLQDAVGELAFRATGNDTADMCARFAAATAATVLPATILLGAAFPAAMRLILGARQAGAGLGAAVALNTAGGIAGTLVTGFVLVPWVGVSRSLGALAVAGALVGAVALSRASAGPRRAAGIFVVALACVLAVALPADSVARYVAERRGGRLLYQAESVGGSVVVLEQESARARFRRLYVDGVSNSGDTLTSLRYMRLQALLPLIVHGGEPRSALVIGLGTGITSGALLTDSNLTRRVVVELLPAVVEAAPLFQGNLGAASDPRLEVRIGDGRHELLRRDERWDVITLEPPPPSAAGVVNLYSRDFYELARRRLAPSGLLAQWWPLHTQNDEASRSLVRSFLDTFPYVSLWTTELHEMLLLGSADPMVLDGPRIATRLAEPTVAKALGEVGVGTPAALLATWVAGRDGLVRYAADALPITDDRPLIEHAGWVRPGEFERTLPRVLAIAAEPPLDDEGLRSAVLAERRLLFRFYEASLAAAAGDRAGAAERLREVLTADPRNPYYRWIVGDRR